MTEQHDPRLNDEDDFSHYFNATRRLSEENARLRSLLRAAFVDRLTHESPHHDARRWDYNAPIFDADEGYAIYNVTDLDMVMFAFDAAVNDLEKGRRLG